MSLNENNNNNNHSNNNGVTTTMSATKLCHIVKRSNYEGYGFNLHSEKMKPGQYIGKVDVHSPAELSGLKEGDKIIEVNGVNIGQEKHKQVVQRIKAIANEVRLLLIDVGGVKEQQMLLQQQPQTVGTTAVINNHSSNSNKRNSTSSIKGSDSSASIGYCQGTVQEMQGASANISSISMITTKRMSNASRNDGDRNSNETAASTQEGYDVADDVTMTMDVATHHTDCSGSNYNNDRSNMAAIDTYNQTANGVQMAATSENSENNSINGSAAINRPSAIGGLHLPMTAAEMRAKLMSKKKYDPKNESVDLKKKFEIIQTL